MVRAGSMVGIGIGLALALASCVTINVYFPAAAAEKAADKIIDEVWGKEPGRLRGPTSEPRSRRAGPSPFAVLLDLLVPAAHAQANIDVSSPAIGQLEASMRARHQGLRPFYVSGAIYLTRDGLVDIRDATQIPLQERSRLSSLVAAENRDRNALYKEIARANGHPEWENDIRGTFARRWVSRAEAGWWYDLGGGLKQK